MDLVEKSLRESGFVEGSRSYLLNVIRRKLLDGSLIKGKNYYHDVADPSNKIPRNWVDMGGQAIDQTEDELNIQDPLWVLATDGKYYPQSGVTVDGDDVIHTVDCYARMPEGVSLDGEANLSDYMKTADSLLVYQIADRYLDVYYDILKIKECEL
jgi:hypothetical protein